MDFVCLICGTRSEGPGDCRHCALPFLDSRTPEAQEAIEKTNEATKHKHDQRLLWIAVAAAVLVLAIGNALTLLVGVVVPSIQQIAFGLLLAFGGWRGLVAVFPAHQVGRSGAGLLRHPVAPAGQPDPPR